MAEKKKENFGHKLRRQGFDLTYYDKHTGYWHVKCSQCEAVFINGIACHEHGCPNQKKSGG